MKQYDVNNIFFKILNKEVECKMIQEDDNNLSFEDINKQAPIHSLTIPKSKHENFSTFVENSSDEEISSFCRSILKVAEINGIKDSGYRIVINCGPDSNQEVPHLHAHILGGKNLGPLLS